MNTTKILHFLRGIAANNDRAWMQAHKAEYEAARDDFQHGVDEAIARISTFDPEIAHLTAKDCCYRFNRDTRFSQDKSPYKRHFGAYICAHGKKSLRGGYYLHLEPGHCMISVGCYYLPTNILTSTRNEIMGNIDEWRRCVEDGQFVKLYGYPGEGHWTWDGSEELSEKGFGLSHLKTCPAGFPRDYEFIRYLRMKDYCTWRRKSDDFFEGDEWLKVIDREFRVAKPMMDFVNAVIDDYE